MLRQRDQKCSHSFRPNEAKYKSVICCPQFSFSVNERIQCRSAKAETIERNKTVVRWLEYMQCVCRTKTKTTSNGYIDKCVQHSKCSMVFFSVLSQNNRQIRIWSLRSRSKRVCGTVSKTTATTINDVSSMHSEISAENTQEHFRYYNATSWANGRRFRVDRLHEMNQCT